MLQEKEGAGGRHVDTGEGTMQRECWANERTLPTAETHVAALKVKIWTLRGEANLNCGSNHRKHAQELSFSNA